MSEKIYCLRRDAASIADLVMAVPNDWAWVDGVLHAPELMVARGEAVDSYGLKFGRFILGGAKLFPLKEDQVPDLKLAFLEQRQPGMVRFEEAGFGRHEGYSLLQFKRLAAGYVRSGYRGSLRFFSACCHNFKFDNPARVDLDFEDRPKFPEDFRLRLKFDPEHGGQEADFGQLIDCIRRYELVPLLS